MKIHRREFLQGCCAGIMAMTGARLTNVTFAQAPGQRDILITVFLRGGMDALSLLAPWADAEYHNARPVLALQQADVVDLDGYFGLNKTVDGLVELYNSGHLALIPACGFPEANRSHFEAQDIVDRGQIGNAARSGDGWLARHINPPSPMDSVFRAVTLGSQPSVSLEGFTHTLAMNGAGDFSLNTAWGHTDRIRESLRTMYGADPAIGPTAIRTLDALDVVASSPSGTYVPQNGAVYPDTGFARSMRSVAQLLRMQVGMEAATVDLGGWDTHENQTGWNDPSGGYFGSQAKQLADGLRAFWTDLRDHHGRLTVVVMSEFGRRLRENRSRGTDHGHGGLMMVLSANVREKRVFGQWPGLAQEQLFESVDVASTTDFRAVLSEVLRMRRGVNLSELDELFPGFRYTSGLGFFVPEGDATAAKNWQLLP